MQEELRKISIEFAKLGGVNDLDEKAVADAVEDTRKLFDLDGDNIVTRDEFADQYMKISGFMSKEDFKSPVTEEQFLASMRYSCPLLFGPEQ